jgi:hypothetical protein
MSPPRSIDDTQRLENLTDGIEEVLMRLSDNELADLLDNDDEASARRTFCEIKRLLADNSKDKT